MYYHVPIDKSPANITEAVDFYNSLKIEWGAMSVRVDSYRIRTIDPLDVYTGAEASSYIYRHDIPDFTESVKIVTRNEDIAILIMMKFGIGPIEKSESSY